MLYQAASSLLGQQSLPESLFGYEVVSRIGRGASADIYTVRDDSTGEFFVMKHICRRESLTLRALSLLRNELQTSQSVSHPNIRAIHRLDTTLGSDGYISEAALLMEYVAGSPLRRHPGLSIGQTLAWFGQVAQALAAMHRANLVHCDIKPGNILITRSNQVKLIDLGQSCTIGTRKQRVQGTPDFMAPEQIRRQPLSPKADIYGFGATLYWALTGELVPMPHFGSIQTGPGHIIPPSQLNRQIPRSVSDLVMACVQPDESRRLADIGQIALRLELMGMASRTPAISSLAVAG